MCGCDRRAAAWASWRIQARATASVPCGPATTFTATWRPSTSSYPRHTMDMPPPPRGSTSRYRPPSSCTSLTLGGVGLVPVGHVGQERRHRPLTFRQFLGGRGYLHDLVLGEHVGHLVVDHVVGHSRDVPSGGRSHTNPARRGPEAEPTGWHEPGIRPPPPGPTLDGYEGGVGGEDQHSRDVGNSGARWPGLPDRLFGGVGGDLAGARYPAGPEGAGRPVDHRAGRRREGRPRRRGARARRRGPEDPGDPDGRRRYRRLGRAAAGQLHVGAG